MRRNPFVKPGEAEFPIGHCFHHELEGSPAGNIQIKSVHQQKRMNCCKSHSIVAVQKRVIIDQGLQEGGCLFAQVVVVTRLGTENSRLQSALIEQSMLAAVLLNLVMVNGDD